MPSIKIECVGGDLKQIIITDIKSKIPGLDCENIQISIEIKSK